jgi:hypothetical protein
VPVVQVRQGLRRASSHGPYERAIRVCRLVSWR